MDLEWLSKRPIAHRGLHDVSHGIIENTPAAFEAAIEAGYPIECDLQLTADEEALVFHDATLQRMTNEPGKVFHKSSTELSQLTLNGTDQTIPTLGDVLEIVQGRVPILIELKNIRAEAGPLEKRTAKLLESYNGPVAVQGFSPQSMGWFAENHPDIPRGQLSQNYENRPEIKLSWIKRFVLRNLLLVSISKPHFISYRIDSLPALAAGIARRTGLPILAWTVRNAHDREIAAKHADNIIFEDFLPEITQSSLED
jgi:glycerophosphoryl diester phosphodiesterase